MTQHFEQTQHTALVAKAMARTASRYEQYAEVYRQIASRLHERLDLLAIKPAVVLDLGCGTGQDIAALCKRYRRATVLGLDVSPAMLQLSRSGAGRRRGAMVAAADSHLIPLATDSIDLVVSNMLLPWCHDPHQVFSEIFRVLAPGGTVLFSTAGPDTLLEYRQLWQQIDQAEHCFGLTDMHDLGDSMLAAGFSAPVLDRENLIIDYPSVAALEQELRSTGATNTAAGRRRGLISPVAPERLYKSHIEGARFPVTLELVQGHAWKGAIDPGITAKSAAASGEFSLSLESLRKVLTRWK